MSAQFHEVYLQNNIPFREKNSVLRNALLIRIHWCTKRAWPDLKQRVSIQQSNELAPKPSKQHTSEIPLSSSVLAKQ